MLFTLLGLGLALCGMGACDPVHNLPFFALSVAGVSLFAGGIYIAGLAYELESLEQNQYSLGSACVITGFRFGMLLAASLALYLATLWDWANVYMAMGGLVALGCVLILIQEEPIKAKESLVAKKALFARHPSLIKGFWNEVILEPCKIFLQRRDYLLILVLLFGFKCGDFLVRNMEGPFYLDVGFDKTDLAFAVKSFGFVATLVGAFIAGVFLKDKDLFYSVSAAGVINACSLFFNAFLAFHGKSYALLYLAVAVENFTGGMAMTLFIFLLWKVCDRRYAAVQYAILWSLFSLKTDLLSFIGGHLAAHVSWNLFFQTGAFLGMGTALAAWSLVIYRQRSLAMST